MQKTVVGLWTCICVLFLFIFGLVPAFSNDLEHTLNEVLLHLNRRDFAAALRLFETLNREDAEKSEIRIMQASILISAGRTADARRIANNILAAEPENTDALMILADAASFGNNARERRTFLDRVIRINPAHTRALIDIANINFRDGNLRTAATFFDRALAAEPDNGEALVGRGLTHRFNGEQREAEWLFNRALNLYPWWSKPFHERARLYKGAGFLEDALIDMNVAKELDPGNYWIVLDRGLILFQMNLKQEALEELSNAIAIDPNNFYAYVYTAGIKDEFGDYEGAIRDYTAITRLKPDYYFAFEGLGVLKMREKKWAEARDVFLEAYKHAPREYNYALLAALNWMRAGRATDPRQFLAQVLRAAPRDSIEFSMLRLYNDLSGDLDVIVKIENEKDNLLKSRMLFYLASYYDVRGNTALANRFYLMVQEIDAASLIEWRLNEWVLAERGIGLRGGE